MSYRVAVTGRASEEELRDLVAEVDRIATIPDKLRRANTVVLSDVPSKHVLSQLPPHVTTISHRAVRTNPAWEKWAAKGDALRE